jgi:2-furoyl-CoA dehydrogenase large subunit
MAWVGQSIERVEDAALLTGRGRYIDDLPVSPGTLHAAVLRSPHPHAVIRAIRADAARGAKGVATVVTGEDVIRFGAPLLAGVRANIACWPIAVGKVRYVGEPVAVVVAADRYLAEDALELIEVDYDPLPITLRPADALKPETAVLHEGLGGNIASDRSFRYGDPEAAFSAAAHRVSVKVNYPRNSCTPIETYGLAPTTTRARMPTMCSPRSRARSAFTRCSPAR